MRLTIEEVSTYKTAVNAVSSLVSKTSVSTIEQCVLLTAEDGVLTVTSSVTDSHAISFDIPATVHEPGKCFILGSTLRKVTAPLKPKSPVFMSTRNGQLHYEVKPHGSIHESLYHDQRGFPKFLAIDGSKDFELIANEEDILPELFPTIAASSFNNKAIFFQSSARKFEIYTQYSSTGYTKFISPTGKTSMQPCKLYIKPALAKMVKALGTSVDIFFNSRENAIGFQGEKGELVVVGETMPSNYSNSTDFVLGLEVAGSVEVNHSDLLAATNWQAYNIGRSEVVDLAVEDGHLTIRCGGTNNPARIVTEVEDEFSPISLHIAPFQLALKTIGSEKSNIMPIQFVKLQQRIYPLSEDTNIKVLTMSAAEDTEVFAVSMLYEVRIVNK